MVCPKCNIEMEIIASRTVAVGDDSPDVQTKVYIEQDLACRNPSCENYGMDSAGHRKVVAQARSYLIGQE